MYAYPKYTISNGSSVIHGDDTFFFPVSPLLTVGCFFDILKLFNREGGRPLWKEIDVSKMNIAFRMDDLQVTVLNANRMEFRESFPKHLHSFYELHYIFAGSGTLLCQGERYPLSAGTLYLNGRNSSHEQLTNPDDPMMEYSVALDIRAGGKKSGIGTALADMRLWIGKDENEIGILFREIEKELEGKRFGDIFLISSLFQMIFVKSLRNFFSENTPGWGRDLNDRRRFLMDEAFIYDYRDMTLSSLAKTLNISQRHAIRSIRAFYGMTFTQFRNQSRLSAAARLLAEDSMGISEIAEAVGFSSTAYFRRLFSQVYGLSPSAYRARQGRRKNDSPNQSG